MLAHAVREAAQQTYSLKQRGALLPLGPLPEAVVKKTLVQVEIYRYYCYMTKSPFDLLPDTLIRRVMSGKKDYRSSDYLDAFASLPMDLLHCNDVSRTEMIKLYNSLQPSTLKSQYYTFSLVRDNQFVIKTIQDKFANEKYAYIKHDKDKTEHKHYHYVLIFRSPRSLKAIANDLELPLHLIDKVHSKRGILNYLTHENAPGKYHYDLSEIQANFDVEEEKKDGGGFPFKEFYEDYRQFRFGNLSYSDFIDKYKMYCATLSISGAMSMSDRLFYAEIYASSSGMGLSSRTDFHVRTPVKKSCVQSGFDLKDPNKLGWLGFSSDPSKSVVFGDPDAKLFSQPVKKSYRKPNPRSDLNDVA